MRVAYEMLYVTKPVTYVKFSTSFKFKIFTVQAV